MKAILVLFDTLRRCSLSPYGAKDSITPNFARLAAHSVTYDRHFVGSLPCMPARRELQTGRVNFLHRNWGPIEPFDDSMPELLKQAGVYTHLVSDHYHYWMDGGETYHTRYASYESVRGHEFDNWKADLSVPPLPAPEWMGVKHLYDRTTINRACMPTPETSTIARTFDAGMEFLEKNGRFDNWMLQIENFCPHEPFYSYPEFRDRFPAKQTDRCTEMSMAGHKDAPPEQAEDIRNDYRAALLMCDTQLGRLLDYMDAVNAWDDTMLIVTTDHGTLLGEHDEWGKNLSAHYNEVANTPLFVWDPRTKAQGVHSDAFNQMIDVAPTLLDFFGVPIPKDMTGKPIRQDTATRDAGLFGTWGQYTCVTDGRYVYMRAPVEANQPLNLYTLMPTTILSRFSPQMLEHAGLQAPFPFTKHCPVLKIPATCATAAMWRGSLLFDLEADPAQDAPLNDPELEARMCALLVEKMREADAPEEQYVRLGLAR